MPSRLDWLAIALLSGLVARWVSKHTIGDDGEIGKMRGVNDTDSIPVNYATLTTSFSVDVPRLESSLKSLAENNLISIERRGTLIFAKPVRDNVEKLYNYRPVMLSISGPTVTMKPNTPVDGALFAEVNPLTGQYPNANAWMIAKFSDKYAKVRGTPYEFKGGRDARAVKNLLKAMAIISIKNVTPDKEKEVDRIFEFYLREEKREYFTGGYALHGLWDNWAALQVRMGKIKVAPLVQQVTNRYYR